MNTTRDSEVPPRRWSDDPDVSAKLRAVLRSEPTPPQPSPAVLDDIASRLARRRPLPFGASLARIFQVCAVVAGLVTLAALIARFGLPRPAESAHRAPAPALAASSRRPLAPAAALHGSPLEQFTVRSTPDDTVEGATQPAAEQVRSHREPVAAARSAPDAAESEATLLERARASLNGDPANTLALTAQHQRDYPHGVLGAEREVLAAMALDALGRTEEARVRARRLLATEAGSLYARRLRHVLGD